MPPIIFETHPGYQGALDYLYSFINYEAKTPPGPEHALLNHDRMRWLLGQFDQPHGRFRSVIIAGTKGKGSTSAMIEAILRAGGYRTGFYSSPHLHSWRERIQVGRELIPQADVVRLMDRLRDVVGRLPVELGPPTTFEIATAIAFLRFAECEIDIAVLEVGMGGRYDTVNIVTPLVAVIMPISYDHMQILGPTLTDIAGVKAGIIKPGVPVISAPQDAEAFAVIEAEARVLGAPLWQARADTLDPLLHTAEAAARPYPVPITMEAVGLRGEHQLDNARVAAGAVMLLEPHGFPVPPAAFAEGLRTVQWPGRFEVVAGNPTVVIDGAMNAASAVRLRAGLQTLPHDRMVLVLGTSRDKDIPAIAAELVPGATAVVVTRSRHPRSADQESVAAAVEPFARGPILITDDIPPALDRARELAGPSGLICVAGSLFVAAAAREALGLPAVVD